MDADLIYSTGVVTRTFTAPSAESPSIVSHFERPIAAVILAYARRLINIVVRMGVGGGPSVEISSIC